MIVKDPGHCYLLDYLDAKMGDEKQGMLTFVKRVGDKYPGNAYGHAGTNMQEVLRALIERVKYVNNQVNDQRNMLILEKLRQCIWLLEDRAAERHGRTLQFQSWDIELHPVCSKCGHIGCQGECH